MTDPSAGEAYSALIIEQLVEERARKKSFEDRGMSVISSSGTLVTLLFALGALVTQVDKYSLPGAAVPWLALALVGFVAAAILGIATNYPADYWEPLPSELQRLTEEQYWKADGWIGARRSAQNRVEVLGQAREVNTRKARVLMTAMACEVGAVIAVAIAVWIILG